MDDNDQVNNLVPLVPIGSVGPSPSDLGVVYHFNESEFLYPMPTGFKAFVGTNIDNHPNNFNSNATWNGTYFEHYANTWNEQGSSSSAASSTE